MCLAVLSRDLAGDFPLVILFNRDEEYQRPTKNLHIWDHAVPIYGGRDELRQGTWLAMNKQGKWALLTVYRHAGEINLFAASRGLLVSNYLTSSHQPYQYLEKITQQRQAFNHFNLICGDLNQAYYYTSYRDQIQALGEGLYGLSNAFLDTPWPKVQRAKRLFSQMINESGFSVQKSFEILTDRFQPEDDQLPSTGVHFERERSLAPIFVQEAQLGTCSSSIVVVNKNKQVEFFEKNHRYSMNATELSLTFTITSHPSF